MPSPDVMDSGEDEGGERKVLPGTPVRWEQIYDLQSPLDMLNPINWGRSMVAIPEHNPHHSKDGRPVIFPPINHEGLFPHSHHDHDNNHHRPHHNQSPLSPPPPPSVLRSSLSSSPCTYDLNEELSLVPPLQKPSRDIGHLARWFRLGIGLLRYKVNSIALSLRNFVANTGILRSFNSTTGALAAATLFMFLYIRFRGRQRRLRMREQRIDYLLVLLKEKDEKIDQLLHQIAQMNEVLLALHKNPTSRTVIN